MVLRANPDNDSMTACKDGRWVRHDDFQIVEKQRDEALDRAKGRRDAPVVTINVPEGYKAVTKTVGEISTTTVEPIEPPEVQKWRDAIEAIRCLSGD
mgnify:CR=1 FL=1